MPRILSRIFVSLPLWWIVSAQAAPELPLWAASSWRNDIATVKAHLAAGTDVDSIDDWTGKTPLHYAAEYGNLEIAVLLLDAGANVRHVDDDKATALHHAAVGGFVDVTKLLLAHGADINAKDKRAETPMDGAVFFGHTNITDLLKEYIGITRYERGDHFLLEVTALAPGWYGFLNKKMRVDSREYQVLASEDLIRWRPVKLLNFDAQMIVYKDQRVGKYRQRFFRLSPYYEPPLKSSNKIDIQYEYFRVLPIDGVLDGYNKEWSLSDMIVNPGFEVTGEGQKGVGSYLSGETLYSTFAEYNGVQWGGDTDHRFNLGIGWNTTGLHVTVVVDDDQHVHSGKAADAGDAVKMIFTNSERNEVLSEFVFALSYDAFSRQPDAGLVDGLLFDKENLSSPGFVPPIGYMEQLKGDAEFDVVIRRNQMSVDPDTGKTVYEFWFSPETVGVPSLFQNFSFGFGVVVIDSDQPANQIQGWSGWGPESVLFESKPSEAAVLTLEFE